MESGGKLIYAAAGGVVALGIAIFVLVRVFSAPIPPQAAPSSQSAAPAAPAPASPGDSVPPVAAGEMAPNFTLKSLSGKEITLDKLRGKVVILNLWATWCGPCRLEMPSMETLYEEFKGNRNFVLLAASQDTASPATVAAFVKKNGYHFTVLLDPKNLLTTAYGASGVPETFVIDRNGRIVAHHLGAFDWSRPDVKQALEELINSKTG